mmetsp:Transcript_32808/g.67115  ORF Transcript_32808/g.67115 Transcript_32808/m.67115 type:complete len:580 (-) Transcript_32808:3594-5333(-)
MQCNEHINSRQQRKLAYRARNRLLSIHRDAQDLKQRVYDILESHHHHGNPSASTLSTRMKSFPWLPNKNCGSWYLPPNNELTTSSTEVYFKSSDGHITSNYAFSLKRLNLPLIELLHQVNSCFLVDSSVRKILPDSFSRTIPVWCCVMNRIVQRYRAEFRQLDENNQVDEAEWDTLLYTPASIVSPDEYAEISSLIDSRVELLYSSKAIVNPSWLVSTLSKPLRPMWIVEGQVQSYTNSLQLSSVEDDKYYTIICCNPSNYHEGSSSKNHIHWKNHSGSDETSFGYYYTPGAADDDSEWGRNLSPNLFWSNCETLLQPNLTDDDTDALIDTIIQRERDNHLSCVPPNSMEHGDKIGNIDLWIGSYEAAKPPTCWDNFDAVLNITDTEYPDMQESIKQQQEQRQRKCFYLQLPVAEGKKDKIELERWMPVGLVFLIHHLQQKRRVLVYGTKGRDRAVAVVLAFVVLACPHTYPLKLKETFAGFDIDTISQQQQGEADNIYHHSDLHLVLVDVLLEKNGRETFLHWMHNQASLPQEPFADKESLRIVLQLVTQYRENAEPTRSTMQKLNRFFMSSSMYRHI